MTVALSVVIPTLNEGEVIRRLLRFLQPLRSVGGELIVADGGSEDDTCRLALPLVDHLVSSEPGRALQMNRGAGVASGDWLWFVHADTGFSDAPADYLCDIVDSHKDWGRFDVQLDAQGWIYRWIGGLMSERSRLTGIATGDQGIFIRRALFNSTGGFPEIPLMEDIELCGRLRRQQWPACIRRQLRTSARRWQRHGVLSTILLMWRLRLAYFLGVEPTRLARAYRKCSSPTREY